MAIGPRGRSVRLASALDSETRGGIVRNIQAREWLARQQAQIDALERLNCERILRALANQAHLPYLKQSDSQSQNLPKMPQHSKARTRVRPNLVCGIDGSPNSAFVAGNLPLGARGTYYKLPIGSRVPRCCGLDPFWCNPLAADRNPDAGKIRIW